MLQWRYELIYSQVLCSPLPWVLCKLRNLDVFLGKGKKQMTDIIRRSLSNVCSAQKSIRQYVNISVPALSKHSEVIDYLYFSQDPILLSLSSKKKFGIIFIIDSSLTMLLPNVSFLAQYFQYKLLSFPFCCLSPKTQTSSLFSWITSLDTLPPPSRWSLLLLLKWLSEFLGWWYYFLPCLWTLRDQDISTSHSAHSVNSLRIAPGSFVSS